MPLLFVSLLGKPARWAKIGIFFILLKMNKTYNDIYLFFVGPIFN